MNKEQFLALLNTKFLGLGVRKDGLAQLAGSLLLSVTTIEEAQALVDKLTESQVTEFVTNWRKEVDGEVSKGIETAKVTFGKKDPAKKEGENQDPPKDDATDPATIFAKLLDEKLKPLQDKLSKYETENTSKSRLENLQSKLAEAPELFKTKTLKDFGRMSFETDEAFTEYLTETEADLTTFKQEMSNHGLSQFGKPFRSSGAETSKTVDAAVTSFIEEKKDGGAGNLGGKEV